MFNRIGLLISIVCLASRDLLVGSTIHSTDIADNVKANNVQGSLVQQEPNRILAKRHGQITDSFQTCADNFDIHEDQIIRTQDSRALGAKYIDERDVPSRDDCLRLCCETADCDVFVFEERCGPQHDFKCKFTEHHNYTSAFLTANHHQHMTELESQIKLTKHEHELTQLRQPGDVATAIAPTSDITTPSGNKETEQVVPATSNVELPINRRCSRYQFECKGSGECIAIYNACDGIPQCSDASDEGPELGCPALLTTIGPVEKMIVKEPSSPVLNMKPVSSKVLDSVQASPIQQQSENVPIVGKKFKSSSWSQQQPSSYGGLEKQQNPSQMLEYGNQLRQPQQMQQSLVDNPNYPASNINGGAMMQQQMSMMPQQQLQAQLHHSTQNQLHQKQQPMAQSSAAQRDAMQPPTQLVNQAKIYGREGEGLLYHAAAAAQNENMQWPQAANSYQQETPMMPQNHISPFHANNNNNGMSQIFNHKGSGLISQSENNNNQLSESLQNDYNNHYNYIDNSQGFRMFPQMQVQKNWQNSHLQHEMASMDDGMMSSRDEVGQMPAAMAPDYYYEESNLRGKLQQQLMGQRMAQHQSPHNLPVNLEQTKVEKTPPAEVTLDHVNHDLPSSAGQGTVKKDSAHHTLPTSAAPLPTEKPKVAAAVKVQNLDSLNYHRRMEQLTAEISLRETTFDSSKPHVSDRPSGAILSLTMGMCVTGIMIIIVGCRMRTVRRRMRRGGRSSYAHDADFLVNGMYL
ncbi:hypothetical protein LSTR_LSTR000888 [Laodelphax striatellus]|uniref:Apple domain-containing protein n=1 Tax=Laodelphax striatellus TaxID=195883 RepID=A0A482X0J0_LAOST|nr:hypothetical protein LSTR_LSTR000888 [Laodelphax striatellus]